MIQKQGALLINQYLKDNMGETRESVFECFDKALDIEQDISLDINYSPEAFLPFYEKLETLDAQLIEELKVWINNNIGTTEEDANKCKEELKKELDRQRLEPTKAVSLFNIIDERLKKLDEEYRTVEGFTFPTRESADETKSIINANKDILYKDTKELIYRNDYLEHIEKIKSVPLIDKLVTHFVDVYQKELKSFDKKCKNAKTYNDKISGQKRSMRNLVRSALVSDEKQKADWEEVTHNGQYSIDAIMGNISVPQNRYQNNTDPNIIQPPVQDNMTSSSQAQNYNTQNTSYAPPPIQQRNYSQPQQNNFNAPPPVQSQSNFQRYSEHKKSNTVAILLAIIVILLLGIAIIGLLFLINGRKNESTVGSGVSSDVITEEVNEQKTTVVESEKAETMEIKAETTTKKSEETPSSNTKGTPIVASQSKDDIYSKYLDIANSMNLVPPSRGFLIDLNSDGINEMIIPDTYDMTYKLYYFDGSSVKSHSFGGFMAVGNFEIFSVDGDNGKKYIYFRDNYSYKSSQGYFSFDDMSEIDIFLNFTNAGSGTADWRISYNGSETYAEGTENVSQLYGETKQCYAKILEAFKKYGYGISDSSKYNSLEGLYYDDFVRKLGGNTAPTTTAKATEPQVTNSVVTPCAKYGTIYAPGGNKVNGYAKSYLIDGGAEAYERHDLTHGWHIKAVNEYYNGIYWYELYDADDGDYYGWVSGECIEFY